jgi:hypothetical protein
VKLIASALVLQLGVSAGTNLRFDTLTPSISYHGGGIVPLLCAEVLSRIQVQSFKSWGLLTGA